MLKYHTNKYFYSYRDETLAVVNKSITNLIKLMTVCCAAREGLVNLESDGDIQASFVIMKRDVSAAWSILKQSNHVFKCFRVSQIEDSLSHPVFMK